MGSRNEPYEAPAIQAFASELTAWREMTGLSKTELAETLGYTPQWIGQVEAAKSIPSKEFAQNLDTHFTTNGVFERQQKRIIETRHKSILPPGFTEYQEREAEANQIRGFDLMLIRGLLQTESYMRAIVGHDQDPDTAERLISERLKRQEILTRENPPHVWFTMDEAALRRSIAGPDVMREQLAHLLAMGERHNVSIDIVPMDQRYYEGLTGSFTILDFTNAPEVAYTESAGQGVLIQDPRRVATFAVMYNSLRGDALRVEESRALITSVMEEYG
ncbi:helix-turn-helix domain-containing protein [Actinomadura napierensis]|uniref:Helix-turn-helix transcriptional regulator n=1 Tax=Actinomadura napierensis TaxID=267854 RepID=A0ABN2ZXL7_9ACTN